MIDFMHLSPLENLLIDRIAARLPSGVAEVIVFGSRARGRSGPESDLDVALVVEGGWSGNQRAFERAVAGLAFDLADDVAGGEIALQLVPSFPGDRRLPLWKEIQRDVVRVCRTKSRKQSACPFVLCFRREDSLGLCFGREPAPVPAPTPPPGQS